MPDAFAASMHSEGWGMRVVVVTDNGSVLAGVREAVVDAGYEVCGFTDPHEAEGFVRDDFEASAVIVAEEIGGVSGLELCRTLAPMATFERPLYLCLMSPDPQPLKVVEALEAGVDDIVRFPPHLVELVARLKAANRRVNTHALVLKMASTDILTGSRNRRDFFETAQSVSGWGETGRISAIMVDIDHFKKVNDNYGHDIGDEVIRGVALLLESPGTICGRIGGEEFAILLHGARAADVLAHAESLRKLVDGGEVVAGGERVSVTCSFGVATADEDDDIDRLLKKADIAMYLAKQAGRNRVIEFDYDTGKGVVNPSSVVRKSPRDLISATTNPGRIHYKMVA
jgi:diguanylate cyclase (GGDEF)-like protein